MFLVARLSHSHGRPHPAPPPLPSLLKEALQKGFRWASCKNGWKPNGSENTWEKSMGAPKPVPGLGISPDIWGIFLYICVYFCLSTQSHRVLGNTWRNFSSRNGIFLENTQSSSSSPLFCLHKSSPVSRTAPLTPQRLPPPQVSNWFANARRRLKNTVRQPDLSWALRIKLYNKYVQGNAERLSVSSDDSCSEGEAAPSLLLRRVVPQWRLWKPRELGTAVSCLLF